MKEKTDKAAEKMVEAKLGPKVSPAVKKI